MSRASLIEEIEAAMLELLLKALGAYEGQLNLVAQRALSLTQRRRLLDEDEEMRKAARILRDRAVSLGVSHERYAGQEWRSLGL
jgi:hypothetical protein